MLTYKPVLRVSTHSRPKAAGLLKQVEVFLSARFNTQPPEGGWDRIDFGKLSDAEFQHTAARRRLVAFLPLTSLPEIVSTHSRPKAAGGRANSNSGFILVSTHSRPKAAGCGFHCGRLLRCVSTHSRPKAAGGYIDDVRRIQVVSTHSRPKAAGR